jgi:hypothetical protein
MMRLNITHIRIPSRIPLRHHLHITHTPLTRPVIHLIHLIHNVHHSHHSCTTQVNELGAYQDPEWPVLRQAMHQAVSGLANTAVIANSDMGENDNRVCRRTPITLTAVDESYTHTHTHTHTHTPTPTNTPTHTTLIRTCTRTPLTAHRSPLAGREWAAPRENALRPQG